MDLDKSSHKSLNNIGIPRGRWDLFRISVRLDTLLNEEMATKGMES